MCEERDTNFGCHWENMESLTGKKTYSALYGYKAAPYF